MTVIRPLIIMAMAASLTACVTDDPSKGGFFGGLGGLVSGNYKNDQDARQARLDALKQRQAEAEKENKELRALLETREEAAQRLTAEVKGMESDLTAARNNLRKMKAKTKDVEASRKQTLAKLEELKKEIATIKGKLASSNSDMAQLNQQLEARKEVLARLSEDVDKMLNTSATR